MCLGGNDGWWGLMKAALLLSLPVAPCMADSLTCVVSTSCPPGMECLSEQVTIAFDINREEFAPAIDPGEPPRRKVTMVQMGGARFPAEAIIMGEARGFWAEGGGGSHVLFMVHGDGTAHYVDDRTGLRMVGTCEG